MPSEGPIGEVLRDLIEATRSLASRRDLEFAASLPAPASAIDIAAAQEELQRPLMREHHELLKLHNGAVFGVGAPDGRIVTETLRVFSCDEMVAETTRLRRNGYNLVRGYAVGALDGYGNRFLVVRDDYGCDGIVDASRDDPTSFGPPFTYPDIRTWLSSEVARLCD